MATLKGIQLTNRRAFSLVELVTVLAIISIAMLFAVPEMGAWRANARLKGAARELYSNLQRARLQAVKENVDVRVRFVQGSDDQDYYYFDLDNDAAHDAGEFKKELFQNDDGQATGVFLGASSTSLITFMKRGTSTNRSVYVEGENASHSFRLTTNNSGAITLTKQ